MGHDAAMRVWSVGHSTHGLDELVALLRRHGIRQLADIRTAPSSRRHPHFNGGALARELSVRGIAYVHLAALGGRRRPAPDSPNGGWLNASFRGYADYALTAEFAVGIQRLRALAGEAPTAMMCSEALWWRCHRRLVADHLVLAGDEVCHIDSDGRAAAHRLTPFAAVSEGRLVYPPRERGSTSS